MSVQYPAHKLCYLERRDQKLLLAAVGETIQTLALHDGSRIGVWPYDDEEDSDDDRDTRPVKKTKLENGSSAVFARQDSELSEASIEIVSEGRTRQKGERRRPKLPNLALPSVSHLITTSNGDYAIAITIEDKAVRVFEVSSQGRLKQLTCRSLPKKLCAIALTHDETTILAADKFGDVWGIPLIPSSDWQPELSNSTAEGDDYKPSATELTVHTKGNLEALRQQQRLKLTRKQKEGLDFEHKLLLGHVSLLTDLIVVSTSVVNNGTSQTKQYIITADRDEHIRISRSIPQTHVIENFCLGHTEFVSKLCVSPWAPGHLVAGNGEPSLRIYAIQTGEQISRCDLLSIPSLRDNISQALKASPDRDISKLTVSGIWPLPSADHASLLVAFEGVPFLFELTNTQNTDTIKIIPTLGNVLDVTRIDGGRIAVAIDTVHESGSYKSYRPDLGRGSQSIVLFHRQELGEEWQRQSMKFDLEPVVKDISVNEQEREGNESQQEKIYSLLGEFLYGLGNLRKWRGKGAEEEDDEADQDQEILAERD